MDNDYMKSPLALLLQKADHVVEVDELTTYIGFCQPHTTGTDEEKWAICRVQYDQKDFSRNCTTMWANGQRQKKLVFDNYADYDYSYKKF